MITLLSAQNQKMQRASHRTLNFGIPALVSQSGLITCPSAKHCAKGCYARHGTFQFKTTTASYEKRLAAIQSIDFVERLTAEIIALKPVAFRWNDSGDFYSLDYLMKAYNVARLTPNVQHYAYTKQVKLIKENPPPPNFTMILSFGGKHDNLINPMTDRHCHVFNSKESLHTAGYIDASSDDSLAWRVQSNKIGLIYHGSKYKTFHTTTTNREQSQWEQFASIAT